MTFLVAIGTAGLGTGLLAYAAWLWHSLRRPAHPQRTAADVARDALEHRRTRQIAACFDIWADAPSWRAVETQYRLDTAKQRKEKGQ